MFPRFPLDVNEKLDVPAAMGRQIERQNDALDGRGGRQCLACGPRLQRRVAA